LNNDEKLFNKHFVIEFIILYKGLLNGNEGVSEALAKLIFLNKALGFIKNWWGGWGTHGIWARSHRPSARSAF
jgi:hypothetical protein